MPKSRKKKRNPQDATLRNIRALKKRVEKLEEWLVHVGFVIEEKLKVDEFYLDMHQDLLIKAKRKTKRSK